MAVQIDKIQLAYGKLQDWERINPVLLKGEPAVVLDNETSIPMYLKLGNGELTFNQLPVIGASEISANDYYTKDEMDIIDLAIRQDINNLEASVDLVEAGIHTVVVDLNTLTERVAAVESNIDAIEAKIDTTASDVNKLVSEQTAIELVKEQVRSRLIYAQPDSSTNFENVAALLAGPWYYGTQQLTVQELRQGDISIIGTSRYLFQSASTWMYDGETSALTSEQLEVLNSGVTSEAIQSIENDIVGTQANILAIDSKIDAEASAENKLLSQSSVQAMLGTATPNLTPAQFSAINSGITSSVLNTLTSDVTSLKNFQLVAFNAVVRAPGANYTKYQYVTISGTDVTYDGFITGVTATGGITSLVVLPQSALTNRIVAINTATILPAVPGEVGSGATASVSVGATTSYTNEKYLEYMASLVSSFVAEETLANKISDNCAYLLYKGEPKRVFKSSKQTFIDPSYTGANLPTSDGTELAPYSSITLAIAASGATTEETFILAPGEYPTINLTGLSNKSFIGAGNVVINQISVPRATAEARDEVSVASDILIKDVTVGSVSINKIVTGLEFNNVKVDGQLVLSNAGTEKFINSSALANVDAQYSTNLEIFNSDLRGEAFSIANGAQVLSIGGISCPITVGATCEYTQYNTTIETPVGQRALVAADSQLVALHSGSTVIKDTATMAPISLTGTTIYALGSFTYDIENSVVASTCVKRALLTSADSVAAKFSTDTSYGVEEGVATVQEHLEKISDKFTATDSAISAKYTKPGTGIPATDLDSATKTVIDNAEQVGNKVTQILATSTDTQYPTAKAVYDQALTPISEIEERLQPTGDIASKEFVATAVSNAQGRTINPTSAVGTGAAFFASWEALLAGPWYYLGRPLATTALLAGDSATYYGASNILYLAKYNRSGDTASWVSYAPIGQEINVIDTKQDILSGSGLLELTSIAGEYNERVIATNLTNTFGDDSIPTKRAVTDGLATKQDLISKSATVGHPQVLLTTDTNGELARTALTSTVLESNVTSPSVPTEGAVASVLTGYQKKDTTVSGNLLEGNGTAASLKSRKILEATSASEFNTASNQESIPTSGSVYNAFQSKISAPANSAIVGTGISGELTSVSIEQSSDVDDLAPSDSLSTVGMVNSLKNYSDATFQTKIPAATGAQTKVLIQSSTAGEVDTLPVVSSIVNSSDTSIPNCAALREASVNKVLVAGDVGTPIVLQSNSNYSIDPDLAGGATPYVFEVDTGSLSTSSLNGKFFHNITTSSDIQSDSIYTLQNIRDHLLYLQFKRQTSDLVLDNSNLDLELYSSAALENWTIRNSILNITTPSNIVQPEGRLPFSGSLFNSTLSFFWNSSATANRGELRIDAMSNSIISVYGNTDLILNGGSSASFQGEVHLYDNAKLTMQFISKQVIVYRHSSTATIDANSLNYTYIDLASNIVNLDTSGNAATATKLATARTIGGVSFNGTGNIDLPGVNKAGNQNTSGNAATATKLATARNLAVALGSTTAKTFDGSANATDIPVSGVLTTANGGTGNIYGAIQPYVATCVTAQATSVKTITLTNYTLQQGVPFNVKFTYASIANATFRINSESAKNIYYNGARTTTSTWAAGDVCTLIYDGTQYHIINVVKSATTAPIYGISVAGNAATATKLATARTIALSGGVTGTATSFDGSGNVTIPVTAVDPAKLSSAVPITKGGTGATTAAAARTNLAVPSSTDFNTLSGRVTNVEGSVTSIANVHNTHVATAASSSTLGHVKMYVSGGILYISTT